MLVFEKGNMFIPDDQIDINNSSAEWKSFLEFLDQFYESKEP